MADYTKRIERERYIDELLARPAVKPSTPSCACGAPARWDVYGKLCCARCVPVDIRHFVRHAATAEDLGAWK